MERNEDGNAHKNLKGEFTKAPPALGGSPLYRGGCVARKIHIGQDAFVVSAQEGSASCQRA